MTSWTPHEYQIRSVEHLLSNPGAALFAEPGLGKTSTTLAAFSVLREQNASRGMLVVAPLRPAYRVWPREASKWSDFANLKVAVLHGKKKGAALASGADVYVINYEGLSWLAAELALLDKAGKPWPFDVLCLDESTKIKNTQTLRFKVLKQLRDRFARTWILTGTPAPNGIENVFGQVYMIDGGQRLGRFVTHFRRQYFIEQPQRGGYSLWSLRRGAQQEIEAKIEDIALTLREQDYLQLPRRMDNLIDVELPAAARATYNDLEGEFLAEVAGGTITAANAAAKAMKLRQVVGGQVYDAAGAVHPIHEAKLDALEDLVEEQSGQPLLVLVGFQHEVAAIRARLGKELPYLGGGVSPTETARIEDAWNRGEIPVLLAHPTTVALGLNLQAGGSAVCWYTLTWSLEEYDQANRRVYRQGQTKPVTIHHLLAADTIDRDVLDALQGKERAQSALMNALKRKAGGSK